MTQNVRTWFRNGTRPAYVFEWHCSECGKENQKEFEDTTDFPPLPLGRLVDLALPCWECWGLDKVRVLIDVSIRSSKPKANKGEDK